MSKKLTIKITDESGKVVHEKDCGAVLATLRNVDNKSSDALAVGTNKAILYTIVDSCFSTMDAIRRLLRSLPTVEERRKMLDAIHGDVMHNIMSPIMGKILSGITSDCGYSRESKDAKDWLESGKMVVKLRELMLHFDVTDTMKELEPMFNKHGINLPEEGIPSDELRMEVKDDEDES